MVLSREISGESMPYSVMYVNISIYTFYKASQGSSEFTVW